MRHTVRLVLAWTVICLVTLGLGWVVIHPLAGSVGAADDDVARWFVTLRTPPLDEVAHVGELIGDTPTGAVVVALAGLGFALWRRTWRPLVFAAVAYLGVGGLYFAATHLDERDRPPVRILDSGLVADHSFPSGHVGTATAIATVLVVLLWTCTSVDRRWPLLLGAIPLLVLLSRLYQGAHHLTDVLVALLYTLVWVAVVGHVVMRPWQRARQEEQESAAPDVRPARDLS